MDSKLHSEHTRDGEVNLTNTDLILTKANKKNSLFASSISHNKLINQDCNSRVKFDMSKNEIVFIKSFKIFNAENVFNRINFDHEKINCKCTII